MLAITPVILIPAGAYLVRSSRMWATGIDLRRAGWVTIAAGVLAAAAAFAACVTR
jgi:hypothetical protein